MNKIKSILVAITLVAVMLPSMAGAVANYGPVIEALDVRVQKLEAENTYLKTQVNALQMGQPATVSASNDGRVALLEGRVSVLENAVRSLEENVMKGLQTIISLVTKLIK